MPPAGVDPVFLVTVIVVVLATAAYVFFWNTCVGLGLSLALRLLSWNQGGASSWIEIGACASPRVFRAPGRPCAARAPMHCMGADAPPGCRRVAAASSALAIIARTRPLTPARTGSLHFSLVAGRVLFKDVRYHSSNQTLTVVKGQLSWRYWLRAPMDESDVQTQAGACSSALASICARAPASRHAAR
jgi:hypothetical protein